MAGQTQPNAAEAHATARDWKPRMSQESLELEHSLRKAVEEAKAELVEKNHELRRARNALQKELASRTEDLAQLTQELIDSRKDLISTKDELAAELVAMNRLHELSTSASHSDGAAAAFGRSPQCYHRAAKRRYGLRATLQSHHSGA